MNFSNSLSDGQLLQAITEGSEDAFACFYDKHKEFVYHYANKWMKCAQISEDITQDVFVNIWLHAGKLQQIGDLRAYITRMTTNKIYDYLRSAQARKRLIWEAQQRTAGSVSAENGETILRSKQTEELIHEALQKLPVQKQRIYELNVVAAKTPKEIAHELNIAPATVRAHLSDTIKYIQRYIKGYSIIIACEVIKHIK